MGHKRICVKIFPSNKATKLDIVLPKTFSKKRNKINNCVGKNNSQKKGNTIGYCVGKKNISQYKGNKTIVGDAVW